MAGQEPESNGDLAESLRRLCQAAAAGDEAAFREFHRRLHPGVRRFLLRRIQSNAELIEELGQRVWVAMWESLRAGRYDPNRSAPTTFVYGIAYNILLQHFRQGRSGISLDDADSIVEDLFTNHPEPPEFIRTCELLDAIRDCIAGRVVPSGITSADREILAAVSRGETEREMARNLGISPSTANARKQLALQRLQDYLQKIGHLADPSEQPPDNRE